MEEASIRKAEEPIGVIGRCRPWARLRQMYTRKPSWPSGRGYRVVIGRAWVSQSVPEGSIAHSVSCGEP